MLQDQKENNRNQKGGCTVKPTHNAVPFLSTPLPHPGTPLLPWLHHSRRHPSRPSRTDLHSASWHQPIPCEAKTKSVNSQEEPAASIIRAALRAESKAFQACLQGIMKRMQERRTDFPTAFIIHPCTLIRVFTMLGEISVCCLWMHIHNLCTAVCRLRMAVQRLQTEISANYLNTCSTLHRQSQHAAWAITARCEWNCTALRETPRPYGAEKQV